MSITHCPFIPAKGFYSKWLKAWTQGPKRTHQKYNGIWEAIGQSGPRRAPHTDEWVWQSNSALKADSISRKPGPAFCLGWNHPILQMSQENLAGARAGSHLAQGRYLYASSSISQYSCTKTFQSHITASLSKQDSLGLRNTCSANFPWGEKKDYPQNCHEQVGQTARLFKFYNSK